MQGERWSDLVDAEPDPAAGVHPAAESDGGRRGDAPRGHARTRSRARAVQAALSAAGADAEPRAAAAMGDQSRAGAGGGPVQVRAGAGLQTEVFLPLNEAYTAYMDMDADDRGRYIDARRSWKPHAASPCGLAPSDISAFALVYEIIRKLAATLMIGRFFGPQEDLGIELLNHAFTGDAETIAQTAITQAQPSNDRVYRLSSVLRAILRAYLPPRAAQEWRAKCRDFVWPPVFATGWAAAARLMDVGTAIAALTAADPLPVKRLAAPSFDHLTQLLEDVGPPWLVAVLYAHPVPLTRDALQQALAIKDPGCDPAFSSGGLAALRASLECFICGGPHFARECPRKPSRTMGGDPPPLSVGPRSAPINMLAAQEDPLVASLQAQLAVQNQLLAAHARLDQQEDRLASLLHSPAGAILAQGAGPSVASLAPTVGELPAFRVGGAEQAGYEYIGLNHGVPIWGRQDLVRASVEANAAE
jgi:hypothetical protein